jgi:hypothetical protein
MTALGDPAAPDWPTGDLRRFETPVAEFCRQNGASPAFVWMIALGHAKSANVALSSSCVRSKKVSACLME